MSSEQSIGSDGLQRSPNHSSDSSSDNSGRDFIDEFVESPEKEESPNKKRVGRFSTIMNLLNTLLGAGILTVPSSFTNAGMILSICLLFFCGILSYISTVQVIKLQLDTESDGFDSLTYKIAGKTGSILYSIMNLIFLILALLSFLVLGADMIVSWFALAKVNASKTLFRAMIVLVYAFILPIPLTLLRDISVLSYFSTATVLFIFTFVIGMIIKGSIFLKKNKKIESTCIMSKLDLQLFYAISIYLSVFSLPSEAPPIIHEYNSNYRKRKIVAGIAILFCFIFVVIPSIFAYLTYGSSTAKNVLNSFPDDDVFIVILRILFFLIVSFSYPVIAQAVMCSLSQLIYHNNYANSLPTGKRTIILIIANSIPVIIGMFLPQAKPAIGISGSLGGCIVDFVFPPVLWVMYYKPKWNLETILCILFAIFGFVTAGVSTYESVLDAISEFKTVKF